MSKRRKIVAKPLTKMLRVTLDIAVEPLRFRNRRGMVAADRKSGRTARLPETVTAAQAAEPLRHLARVGKELELLDGEITGRRVAHYYAFAGASVVDAKFVR